MTLFQALVSEKYPKLIGQKFDAKVQELEQKWGKNSYSISENRCFFEKFKISVQIWQRVRNPKNGALEVKLVFDSLKREKLSIVYDNFSENVSISLQAPILYVKEPADLNYWFCHKKFCHFGTNRYDKYMAHLNSCTDETQINYKQHKYSQPNSEIAEQLFREQIIPSVSYQNVHFLSYDVGESDYSVEKIHTSNILWIFFL